jgi:hypothetical protein
VSDARPRVTAYFEEPDRDGEAVPLYLAVGRALLAVAGLEKMMLLEIAQLLVERNPDASIAQNRKLAWELSRLECLTGGQLLRELRNLDLSPDLDERIGDAIDRRKRDCPSSN